MQVEAAEANGIETAAAAAVKIDHGRDDDDVQEDCCGRCLCRCHCRGRRRSGRHRRGRRPGRPGSLRTQLQFVLVSLFCWQSCVSVHKFLLGRVTSTFAQEHEERVVWPAVTVCPVDAEPKTRIRVDKTFKDAYSYALENPGKAVHPISHHKIGGKLRTIGPVDEDGRLRPPPPPSPPSPWRQMVGFQGIGKNVPSCLTYSLEQKEATGYESVASFALDNRDYVSLLVFFHEQAQLFMNIDGLFGVAFLQIPKAGKNFTGRIPVESYKITSTRRHTRPRSQLPCHREEKFNMRSCLEDFFESKIECRLPWRTAGVGNGTRGGGRACSTKEDLQRYHDVVMSISITSSEHIYKTTGCYYSCTYTKYGLRRMTSNTYADFSVEKKGFSFFLMAYLSPTATLVETEILNYDFYDLIGDIGGFLGLLLGKSLLSLYDAVSKVGKEGMKKSRRKCQIEEEPTRE